MVSLFAAVSKAFCTDPLRVPPIGGTKSWGRVSDPVFAALSGSHFESLRLCRGMVTMTKFSFLFTFISRLLALNFLFSLNAISAISIRAPDVGVNGQSVPITSVFNPGLSTGERAVLYINGKEALVMEGKKGTTTEVQTRFKLPEQTKITITRTSVDGKSEESTKSVVMDAGSALFPDVADTINSGSLRYKFGDDGLKILIDSKNGFANSINITDSGFSLSVTGSSQISSPVYIMIKGSFTSNVDLSLTKTDSNILSKKRKEEEIKLAKERAAEETRLAKEKAAEEEMQRKFTNQLNGADPQAMYLAAGTYQRVGDSSKASAIYEALISRFPSSNWAVKASDQLSVNKRANDAESAANQRQYDQQRANDEASKKSRSDCSSRISRCEDSCGYGSGRFQCTQGCKSICNQF